jgi:predicted DNA-binding transcriptional regulator AlpA
VRCACLCGKEFEPKRSNQVYFNAAHRRRDKDRRWPRRRVSLLPVASTNGQQEHRKAKISGVQPLLGTAMAQSNPRTLTMLDSAIPHSAVVSVLTAELLTTHQVAAILGCTRWTLNYWRKQRQGPPFVMLTRGTIRYPRASFESWLKARLHSEGKRVPAWGRTLLGS